MKKIPSTKILEGKTLWEVFKLTQKYGNPLIQEMRNKFGDTKWNKEKDEYFTEDEKEWLQLTQVFLFNFNPKNSTKNLKKNWREGDEKKEKEKRPNSG